MKIYNLDVRNDIIEPKNIVVPSGNAKNHQLKFNFDESWTGLPKICIFSRDGKEYPVALDDDNACMIPSDMAMDAGAFAFGMYGYDTDGTTLNVRISTNKLNGLIVEGAYTGDDEATLSLYEQLVVALDQHETDTNNPHKVTAEQVGAYSKEAIDAKLKEINNEIDEQTNFSDFEKHVKNEGFSHPDATAHSSSDDFDLTKLATCSDGDLSYVEITKDALQGGGNTFVINYTGKADVEIYADSFLYITINGVSESVEYQDTFSYSGNISSFTVYVSAGIARFNKFTTNWAGKSGFMSSDDKKAVDKIPNLETRVDELKDSLGDIDTALDSILAIQNSILGG